MTNDKENPGKTNNSDKPDETRIRTDPFFEPMAEIMKMAKEGSIEFIAKDQSAAQKLKDLTRPLGKIDFDIKVKH